MVYSARADKPGNCKIWWEGLPNSVLQETAWERQMNLTGIDAYEAARSKSDPTSTTTGQKMLRRMIDTATVAISEMQQKVIKNTRRDRNLKGTTLVVPAETTALLTLKVMIDRTYAAPEPTVGAYYQGVVMEVSKGVEMELNFRHWVQQSKEAARAYAKTEGLTKIPKSQAERLIEEHGANRSSLARWRNTFKELGEYQWDTLELHYCGDALVTAVADAMPEEFLIHHFYKRGKNQKHIRMTDEFRDKFDAVESRYAQIQSVKKPMLTKPKRWERND